LTIADEDVSSSVVRNAVDHKNKKSGRVRFVNPTTTLVLKASPLNIRA